MTLLGIKEVRVMENTRALVLKRGKFQKILRPGVTYLFGNFQNMSVDVVSLENFLFNHHLEETLIKNYPQVVDEFFTKVVTKDNEVALVYKDNRVHTMIRPGQQALFWKENCSVDFKLFDYVAHPEISEELIPILSRLSFSLVYLVTVKEAHKGLFYRQGKFVKELEPGVYAFWKIKDEIEVEVVDQRIQQMEVVGQEILTKDRVSVRANLTTSYKIVDPKIMKETVAHFGDYIHKKAQFALREVLGTKTLDEILDQKDGLDQELMTPLKEIFQTIGVEIDSVNVKDIILPGDMRIIFNKVVEAEKQAQANLIHRREETAATRSLLNTAKMMENNPVLLRLKELEAFRSL